MEKYIKIIELLVAKQIDRDPMIQYLNTVSRDPFMYEDTYFRMPDERQDMVWLAMLDNLIEKGYAFEIAVCCKNSLLDDCLLLFSIGLTFLSITIRPFLELFEWFQRIFLSRR